MTSSSTPSCRRIEPIATGRRCSRLWVGTTTLTSTAGRCMRQVSVASVRFGGGAAPGVGRQAQQVTRPRRWEQPALVLAGHELDNRRRAFQLRKLLGASVLAGKKGGEISTFS